MVTYYKTGMCCNDWGAQYNLGYLNKLGFESEKEEEKVIKNMQNKKSFELLKHKMLSAYNKLVKKVLNLNNINSKN